MLENRLAGPRLIGLLLKAAAPVFVGVGMLHLALGPEADVLLGARITADVLADPVVDSQNRFYGVAFSVYGLLLWYCAGDLVKHRNVLRILLWVFFAAGCARIVSIVLSGLPSLPVLVLLATELTLPPLALVWLHRSTDPAN